MSVLPRYERLQEDIECQHDSLLPHAVAPERACEWSSTKAVYPPPLPANQPTSSNAPLSPRPNVAYTYAPKGPLKDPKSFAYGVLAETRQATLPIVRRGFRDLNRYSDDRIEFFTLIPLTDGTQTWGSIMDEAWEGLYRNPPAKILICLTEPASNEIDNEVMAPLSSLRKSRTSLRSFIALEIVILFVLLIVAFRQK